MKSFLGVIWYDSLEVHGQSKTSRVDAHSMFFNSTYFADFGPLTPVFDTFSPTLMNTWLHIDRHQIHLGWQPWPLHKLHKSTWQKHQKTLTALQVWNLRTKGRSCVTLRPGERLWDALAFGGGEQAGVRRCNWMHFFRNTCFVLFFFHSFGYVFLFIYLTSLFLKGFWVLVGQIANPLRWSTTSVFKRPISGAEWCCV